MRIKLLAVIAAILLAFFMLPISPYGNKGFYNSVSNALYCNDAYSCRHEIGHRMDDDLGHPSRSGEFAHAIRLYLYVELHKEPVSNFAMGVLVYLPRMGYGAERFPIMTTGQEELYADMYAWVDGDIEELPERFREFYSRDATYSELYRCLTKPAKVNLCDRSVYISR